MTFKIERVLTRDGFVVFRVSGRIDATYVEMLHELMEKEKTTKGCILAIDLGEVTLVSQEVVEALGIAESNSKTVRPMYANGSLVQRKRHD
jgi:anti-anti-sigma regulatory factor